MNSLIINGQKIEDYIQNMKILLDKFSSEIEILNKLDSSLIWESNNKDSLIAIYRKKITKHYNFAKKCFELLSFLSEYTNKYANYVQELTSLFSDFDDKFNIRGDNI